MTMALSRMARSIPPNVFERMDRKVADARVRGIDVIDLSKGNPDGFPEARIRAEAKAAVDDPANARYTPFDGKPSFLQAAAGWYAHEHGVTLDPERELFAVEGAVDGLSAAFAVLLDPGDVVAFADPYYPSYHCMAQMLGAQELLLPARAELGWLPDLDAVPEEAWDRVKLLVLNYPNNPTGAQAPPRFFARAVELATRHGFTMVHDFAYAGLGVHGDQGSLLAVPGARDVGLEIVSLSKMYAMAGWRAGFVAGNEQLVSAVKRYTTRWAPWSLRSCRTLVPPRSPETKGLCANKPHGMRHGVRSWPAVCTPPATACSRHKEDCMYGCRRLRR